MTITPTLRAQVEKWRAKATESHEEAGRIRRTIKEATGAEERCLVRAEVWDKCASELEALLADPPGDPAASRPQETETELRLRQRAEQIVEDIQAHRDNEQGDETIVRHVITLLRGTPETPGGWQPIETAPKDGTVLLGWSPMWAVGLPETMIWLDGNRIGWHTYAGHHMFVKQPTHWRPLPPAPPTQKT